MCQKIGRRKLRKRIRELESSTLETRKECEWKLLNQKATYEAALARELQRQGNIHDIIKGLNLKILPTEFGQVRLPVFRLAITIQPDLYRAAFDYSGASRFQSLSRYVEYIAHDATRKIEEFLMSHFTNEENRHGA